VQSDETVSAIRAIFGLLPAACYVIGGLLFTRFAFNEAEHAAARAAIEQRANP
jgi:Na+/melibiose symporter-like transporter